jgi:hypothetical protein
VNEKLEQEEERYISLFGAGEKGEKEVRDVLQKELVHSLVLDVVKPGKLKLIYKQDDPLAFQNLIRSIGFSFGRSDEYL